MSTRYILLFIHTLVFLVGIAPHARSQNAPVTTIANVGDAVAGNVFVPITVTGFNNIGAISLSIDYDYSVLHFVGGTAHPLLPSFPLGDIDLGSGYHRISMGWYGSGVTLPDGTTMMTLQFTYISGNSSLAFYDNGPSCEYADANLNVLNDTPAELYYINGNVCGPVNNPGEIAGSAEVCAGQSGVNYSIAPIVNATGYSWAVPEGALIISGNNTNMITVDYSNTAVSGEISVFGTGPCGYGPSSQLPVTVNDLPLANAGTDFSIPYGTTTTLNAAPGGPGTYGYHWSPEELLVNPDVQNPQTVNLTSTTLFTLIVTDMASLCQNTDQVMVTVTGGPLNINPIALPGDICLGESSQLYANAGGGAGTYTYMWTSNPPGNPSWSSDLPNPPVTPDTSTLYLLTVYDGFNMVNGYTGVQVYELPTATISGGDTLCGMNVFTNLPVDLTGTPPWSFIYSYGNTSVFVNDQYATPFTIIASDPGDYIITFVEDLNCIGSSYGTALVRKFPIPDKPEITVYLTELISSSCCGNQWYKDGVIIPGASGQTYQVTVNGEYFVIVTMNGCSSEPSDTVDMIVDITESPQGSPAIYPNPANKQVSINLSAYLSEISLISIYSTSGILMFEKNILNGEKNIILDTGMLIPGIYLLVFRGNNTIMTARLVIH